MIPYWVKSSCLNLLSLLLLLRQHLSSLTDALSSFRNWPFQNVRGQTSHRHYWTALSTSIICAPFIPPGPSSLQRINKQTAATAGKTQGLVSQGAMKHLFGGGESDGEVFSSLSCRSVEAFYDKLMHSVTQWGHTHTNTLLTPVFPVFYYVIFNDRSAVSQHE